MSISIGVFTATAMFLAIGSNIEEEMQNEVCGARCEPPRIARIYASDPAHPEKSWTEQWGSQPICPIDNIAELHCIPRRHIEDLLLSPKWVPSFTPTNVGFPGFWMKLQI